MQRMMQTTLMVLVLAISLTAGSLVWRVASAPQVAPDLDTTDPAIGYAFYQALDEVLASGDRSALNRVVSSEFIDHDGNQNRTAGELASQLTSMRASFPDLRIQVLDIRSADETLIASIAPMPSTGPVIEGLQLTSDPALGGFEVLRIDHGKVSERWASALPGIERASFANAASTLEPISSQSIKLEEIDLPANGRFSWSAQGDRALMVKSGSIELDIRSIGSEGEDMRASKTAAAGQALSSPAGEMAIVRTEPGVQARVLVLTMQKFTPANPSSIELGQGATLELLWSSHLPFEPGETWRLSFGRIALSADSTGMLTGDAQSTVLLANTAGAASLTVDSGQIATLGHSTVPDSSKTIALLDTGDAAMVERPASMEIANTSSEPAVIWFIGVRIDAPPVMSASPSGTPVLVIPRDAGFMSE